jgi:inosine-uridine nucleoside N-ribohydrolase
MILVDTDIGDDIDDAFALALVLDSPELHLLGVTTVYGDTEMRARLVDRFLGVAGHRGIPVAAGQATPHENLLTQAAYARQAPPRRHGDAATFLLSQIRIHPGQITLVALGPLFNVQAAIERDPETFRQLKQVVLMGGSVNRGYDNAKTGAHQPPEAEWNLRLDPAGARALFGSGVPVFLLPLDATQIHLDEPSREAIFSHGSPLTDQLTLLYHQWASGNEWHATTPTLYDPLAVAYTLRPELCPMTPMRLEVDEKGFTRPAREVSGEKPAAEEKKGSSAPLLQVCLQADERGFLDFLLERIAGGGAR